MAELERSGARGVHRGPVDVAGNVEVLWRESAAVEEYRRDMAAWRAPQILAVAFALAVMVVAIVLGLA